MRLEEEEEEVEEQDEAKAPCSTSRSLSSSLEPQSFCPFASSLGDECRCALRLRSSSEGLTFLFFMVLLVALMLLLCFL